jgi:hypothetical protein
MPIRRKSSVSTASTSQVGHHRSPGARALVRARDVVFVFHRAPIRAFHSTGEVGADGPYPLVLLTTGHTSWRGLIVLEGTGAVHRFLTTRAKRPATGLRGRACSGCGLIVLEGTYLSAWRRPPVLDYTGHKAKRPATGLRGRACSTSGASRATHMARHVVFVTAYHFTTTPLSCRGTNITTSTASSNILSVVLASSKGSQLRRSYRASVYMYTRNSG